MHLRVLKGLHGRVREEKHTSNMSSSKQTSDLSCNVSTTQCPYVVAGPSTPDTLWQFKANSHDFFFSFPKVSTQITIPN